MNIILLLIAILPIYVICLYIYQKDYEKEPKKLLTKLFIFGMLSCIPALILELVLGHFFSNEGIKSHLELFINVTISIAFAEEICKWLVIYFSTYNNKEFDHIYDAIVYCIFTALGFALVENLLYVFLSGWGVGLFRAVTAVPGHAAYAIIMATLLGKAKQAQIGNNKSKEHLYIALSIIAPTIGHSIYDYLIMDDEYILLLAFVVFVVVIFRYSYMKVRKLANVKENMH